MSSSKKGFLQTSGFSKIKMKTSLITNKFSFNTKRRDTKGKEKEKDQEKNDETKPADGHGHGQ